MLHVALPMSTIPDFISKLVYADTTFSHNIKTSEVINIDYLVKWHLGWEILVGRGKVSFWKQEKWASVRICATFTRAKL